MSCKAELTVHEGNELTKQTLQLKKTPKNFKGLTATSKFYISLTFHFVIIVAKSKEDPMDEETFLRKIRRLTDNYDIQNEIGR